MLYYFLSNRIEDLGLKELGFSLRETKVDGANIIRTYFPVNSKSNYAKVEMVHENHLPIYCAYYDAKDQIVHKIYYSNYQNISSFIFPNRVTEIVYSGKDSIISRMVYSNVKIDNNATSPNFEFTVPSNAKVVQDPSKGIKPIKK